MENDYDTEAMVTELHALTKRVRWVSVSISVLVLGCWCLSLACWFQICSLREQLDGTHTIRTAALTTQRLTIEDSNGVNRIMMGVHGDAADLNLTGASSAGRCQITQLSVMRDGQVMLDLGSRFSLDTMTKEGLRLLLRDRTNRIRLSLSTSNDVPIVRFYEDGSENPVRSIVLTNWPLFGLEAPK